MGGAKNHPPGVISWWVVAQGEASYSKIFNNPGLTPHVLPKDRAGLGFMSQIGTVFHDRFGEELTDVDLGQV